MAHAIRYLGTSDLERLLLMEPLISSMGNAFVALSTDEAVAPARMVVEMPNNQSRALLMPAASGEFWSVKSVSISEQNPAINLPYIQALVYLVDARHGRPLAILEGTFITKIRTGAASGLATKLLAREDSYVMAIFGSGGQAFHQVEAVRAVRNIETVQIFSRNEMSAKKLAFQLENDLRLNATVNPDREHLIDADIITTVTRSLDPLFSSHEISPGTHINAVGAYRLDMCEIPERVTREARVVVDERESAREEAGDLHRAGIDHNCPELGEIVLGLLPGRENRDQVTMFKSVGNAVQDLWTAKLAFEQAEEQNVGILLPFGT